MSKITQAVAGWFESAFTSKSIYTNLPTNHHYFIELDQLLFQRKVRLVFDPNLEKYSDKLNVFFRVDNPDDRSTVPTMNALYRALIGLDLITGKVK